RRGGVDTAKAAKSLGVTQRAVNYWLSGKYRPKVEVQKTIATKSRQAATTKRGRQRLVQHARAQMAKTKNKSPQIFVVGNQGPRNADPNYLRHRVTNLWQNLGPDDVDTFISAWEEGGETAALEWLTQAFGDSYLDEWGFESIDQISFTDPRT
ncbi:DNA-binding XRE family transcriptional regulator, partial [Arthrobacter sp. GAS37]|uniref:hypothetical protein n=1 Tax=Arthrobacter sp. GAS37 TaxID=3156261 RepID=UPI003832F8C5